MRPWPIFTLATGCTTKGKGLPTQQVLTLHLRDHFTSIFRRTSGVHHYLSIHDFFHIYLSRCYVQECLSPTLCGVHLWTLCIIKVYLSLVNTFFHKIINFFIQCYFRHFVSVWDAHRDAHSVTGCKGVLWASGTLTGTLTASQGVKVSYERLGRSQGRSQRHRV